MVRLLEMLWKTPSRFSAEDVDTHRLPSKLRGLTRPGSPRRSFRPQLEALEDRLTPSLDFFPVAHVAVNPQPLPPLAVVEFDPLPNLASVSTGISMQQEHLTGFLSKQIGMPGSATACWILEAFYNLNATVTETAVPPSPFAAGSLSDTFSLTGTVTDTLIPVAPTTGPTWVFSGTIISEQGMISGPLNMPSPTALAVDTFMWNLQATENGAADPFLPFYPTLYQNDPTPGSADPYLAQFPHSSGVINVSMAANGGVSVQEPAATFAQQDVVTACFMPVPVPGHPPDPCITINANFSTWGSMTDNVFLGQSNGMLQQLDLGTTQYTDQAMETIMMPDGNMQTVYDPSLDQGSFVSIILEGG